MDPNAFIGMVFTLILVLLIGGFIVLWPLTRRLGVLLEQRLSGKQVPDAVTQQQLADLQDTIAGMQAELERIADRQDFVDNLLASSKQNDTDKLIP